MPRSRQSHRVARRGVNEAVSLVGGRDMGRECVGEQPPSRNGALLTVVRRLGAEGGRLGWRRAGHPRRLAVGEQLVLQRDPHLLLALGLSASRWV